MRRERSAIRWLVLIAILALGISACAAREAKTNTGPEVRLKIGDATYTETVYSYCWPQTDENVACDVNLAARAQPRQLAAVAPGAPLAFDVTGADTEPQSLTVTLLDGPGGQTVLTGAESAGEYVGPTEPGQYRVQVDAQFADVNGSDAYVSYVFGLDVQGMAVAAAPTEQPTEQPTDEPAVEPTEEVTEEPTVEPTEEPTEEPTVEPTVEPTAVPTETAVVVPSPTDAPTLTPAAPATEEAADVEPTMESAAALSAEMAAEASALEAASEATDEATSEATEAPTDEPTEEATETAEIVEPTAEPTEEPTTEPAAIAQATEAATEAATEEATQEAAAPTEQPTEQPDGEADATATLEATEDPADETPAATEESGSLGSVALLGNVRVVQDRSTIPLTDAAVTFTYRSEEDPTRDQTAQTTTDVSGRFAFEPTDLYENDIVLLTISAAGYATQEIELSGADAYSLPMLNLILLPLDAPTPQPTPLPTATPIPAQPTPTATAVAPPTTYPGGAALFNLVYAGRSFEPLGYQLCAPDTAGALTDCVQEPTGTAQPRRLSLMRGAAAQLLIAGDRPSSVQIEYLTDTGVKTGQPELRPGDNTLLFSILPEPGQYILAVVVTWDAQQATYYYRVAVEG